MSIPANSIMMVTFHGLYAGQTILFTRHYRNFATIAGDIDPQGLQEAFYDRIKEGGPDDIVTPYVDCLSDSYEMDTVRCQLIHPTRFAFSEFLVATSGTMEDPAATGNVQAALTLRTNGSGRDQVATYKLGPIASNMYTGGVLNETIRVAVRSFGSALLESVSVGPDPFTSDWLPVIYHPVPKVPGVYSDVVESRSDHREVRTISRRTVGRGI